MKNFDPKRLRKELRPIAESVPETVRDPESIRLFLEEQRRRPVYLLPCSLRARTVGAWVEEESEDFILYERNTSPFHQQHIILHEAAHMLLGHTGATREDIALLLAPRSPRPMIRSIVCHSVLNTRDESAAEILAVLMETRMERLARFAPADESFATRNIMRFMAQVGGME